MLGTARAPAWRSVAPVSWRSAVQICARVHLGKSLCVYAERRPGKAIVGNIGHFDNEIDIDGLKKFPGIPRISIKPQHDQWARSQ
jgi:hypothetical protein